MSLSRGSFYWKSLIVVILTIPFFYNYAVFNSFEFPKFVLFVAGVIGSGLIFIAYNLNSLNQFQNTKLTKLILLYLAVVFLSDIFGVDPRVSLVGSMYRHQGFIALLCGVLIYFLVRFIPKEIAPKAFSFFIKAVFITTIGVCISALYHIFASYILLDNTIPLYNGRIVATFGNPDFLSGYLVIMLPFVMLSKNFLEKYISHSLFLVVQIIILCGIFAVILFTQSRGSLLFASILFFLSLSILIFRSRPFFKLLLGIVLVVFIVGMSFYYPVMFSKNQRISEWESRTLFYTTGLKAVLKRPFLGYGQENFEFLFPLSRHLKVDSAHNIFLEVAVASGVIGLLLFCSIVGIAFFKANITIRLSLVGFLLVASVNPVSIAHVALFWLLLGFSKNY